MLYFLRIVLRVEDTAQLFRCWRSSLVWRQGASCKTHGSSDANAVYSTIRQIRTMLETDVVAQTAREFSGE